MINGNCDIDIVECISSPCVNGAVCTDSTSAVAVPLNAYSCQCVAGFANGVCAAGFIVEYTDNCTVTLGGNCDLDIDECDSYPCANGANCSHTDEGILPDAYECTCAPGWQGENCALDIDECLSQPCQNGGACTESSTGARSNVSPRFLCCPCRVLNMLLCRRCIHHH